MTESFNGSRVVNIEMRGAFLGGMMSAEGTGHTFDPATSISASSGSLYSVQRQIR